MDPEHLTVGNAPRTVWEGPLARPLTPQRDLHASVLSRTITSRKPILERRPAQRSVAMRFSRAARRITSDEAPSEDVCARLMQAAIASENARVESGRDLRVVREEIVPG